MKKKASSLTEPATHQSQRTPSESHRVLPLTKWSGQKSRDKSSKSFSLIPDHFISIIVFAFAFLLYANTINHGYVLDDDVVYLKNKDVQSGIGGIKSILQHSFIYGFTGHNDQSYRPVVLVVYAIEKEFFGNNPHTGHFINVLLFAVSCVLLFRLLKTLFKTFPGEHLRATERNGIRLAGVAVFLFASHPIHTETVANIKGRDDILNFIFFVLSLTYTLHHLDTGKKKHFLLSLLFFFLALLSKEIAVTFLAVIPLTVFIFTNTLPRKILSDMLYFTGVLGMYMLIRNGVLDAVTFEEKMKVVNNGLVAATSGSDRVATAILILGKYLMLLFFPYPLSWDYSYNQIPIVSFSDIKVIGTLCVFAGLGLYALVTLVKIIRMPVRKDSFGETTRRKPVSAVYAYCILFFFITLSVVSNLFILIGSTLGERFLFIPSLAFCISVAVAICPHDPRSNLPSFSFFIQVRSILFFLLLFLFSLKTYSRNKDWKDNFSLFASGVEATPNSSRAESALGSSYREMGEKEQDPGKRMELFRKALVYYKKAIEILPDNTEALYNAGVSYYGMGDKENALNVYQQALRISPEYTNAANNVGVIYFERNEYEKASNYFLQAIKYDPINSDALGNLGAINHNQGNLQQAIEYYKKALSINPANQNVQRNLAKAEQALAVRNNK